MFRLTYLISLCVFGHLAGRAQCFFVPIDTSGFECTSARYLCGGELDGYSGTLTDFDTPGTQPGNFCGVSSPENIQWFSFLVSDTEVEINISFSDCKDGVLFDQGFQSGIYSGCNFITDDLICISQTVVSGINNLVFTTTPGIHYLFVDGFAGSICDFSIEVVSGVCLDPFAETNSSDSICSPSDINNLGASAVQICQGDIQFLRPDLDFPPFYENCGILDSAFASIVDDQPFYCVETMLSDPTAGTFITGESISISYGSPQSTEVSQPITVRWDEVGVFEVTQTIYVNPYLPHCLAADTICSEVLIVTVLPYDTIFLAVDTICQGELYPYCDDLWDTSQTIICENTSTCMVEVQPLFVQPRVVVDLDSVYICNGSCFGIRGNNYCIPGKFSDTSSAFCDTIFNFTVVPIMADLAVVGDTLITCTNSAAVLEGVVTTNFPGTVESRWLNESGVEVSNDEMLSTGIIGMYTFELSIVGLDTCAFLKTVSVIEEVDLPTVQLSTPTLSCSTLSGNIESSTTSDIQSYEWSGPDGFTSTSASPMVSDTGRYELTVIATNGCKKDTSVHVMGLFEEPDLAIMYQNLDCNVSIGTASYISCNGSSPQWLLPNSTIVNSEEISYSESGDYVLTITGANGCSRDSLFTILNLVNEPSLEIVTDTIWRCNTTEIVVSIAKENLTSIWSTQDGTVASTIDSIKMTTVGTYVGVVTDLSTGCTASDTIVIEDDPNILSMDFQIQDPLCQGDSSGRIEGVFLGGQSPFGVLMNGAASQLSALENLPAGTYQLHFEDLYNCEVDTSITLVDPAEITIESPSPVTYRVGSDLTLSASHNVPQGEVDRVEWFDKWGDEIGSGENLTLSTAVDSFYTVAVWNLEGCYARAAVEIIFDYTKTVYAPTVFSPDGDGHHDRWFLKSVGVPDFIDQVQVFSRWGEMVYHETNINYNNEDQGWDGSHQGEPCPPGVYVYKAVFSDINGVQQEQSGSVTILR